MCTWACSWHTQPACAYWRTAGMRIWVCRWHTHLGLQMACASGFADGMCIWAHSWNNSVWAHSWHRHPGTYLKCASGRHTRLGARLARASVLQLARTACAAVGFCATKVSSHQTEHSKASRAYAQTLVPRPSHSKALALKGPGAQRPLRSKALALIGPRAEGPHALRPCMHMHRPWVL